jgi:hypothetical protein
MALKIWGNWKEIWKESFNRTGKLSIENQDWGFRRLK